jgi:hypothetical protein
LVPAPNLNSRRVLRNDFVEVEVDYSRRIVVLQRSAVPFRQPEDIDRTIVELAQAVPDHLRSGSRILIDMRQAPTRPKPELDTAFQRYRTETERGFERVAVVVESTLGKVRSDRLKSTTETEVQIFQALEAARSWLLER